MNNKDYTTLSYFARAVVADPSQIDEFAEALQSEVVGLPGPDDRSAELKQAVAAIQANWHEVVAEIGGVPEDEDGRLDLIVRVVELLKQGGTNEGLLAAIALVTAMQDVLASKRRQDGRLSWKQRQIASQLPALAST